MIAFATLIAATGSTYVSTEKQAPKQEVRAAVSKPSRSKCVSARMGLAFYRVRYSAHRSARGVSTPYPAGRKPRSCADARYLADLWRSRAYRARKQTERYQARIARITLRDFAWRAESRVWFLAIEQVQRVFPGTSGWLISCSGTESARSHRGYWVGYGNVPYSTWLRDSNTVGGPLQFRFQTFIGMFRRGVEFAVERGFRIPRRILEDRTAAWRSALGQAIAGGWARYTGNDDSHWSASWGKGC